MRNALRLAAVLSLVSVPCIRAAGDVTRKPLTDYPKSLDEALAIFPSSEATPAAIDLEALAAKLGIDLAPRGSTGRVHPGPEAVAAFRPVEPEIGLYLTRQLEDPGTSVDSPSATVARFLSDREAAIASIRGRLVTGPPPRWERHLERLASASIPNLLGHVWLEKLLLADALARTSEGDDPKALLDLEASWALNTSLRDEPTLICQLVAMSVTRLQAGALRKLRDVPDAWIDRLGEHSFRSSVQSSLFLEGWIWTQSVDFLDREPGSWGQRIASVAGKPYARLCFDDAAETLREYVTKVAELDSLCDADLASLHRDLHASIPWWNRMAERLFAGLTGVLPRVARLEVDLELTTRVLQLEAAKRRAGTYPTVFPGAEQSSACPSLRWIYDPGARGGVSITLSRDLVWENVNGALLPTRSVRRERTIRPR